MIVPHGSSAITAGSSRNAPYCRAALVKACSAAFPSGVNGQAGRRDPGRFQRLIHRISRELLAALQCPREHLSTAGEDRIVQAKLFLKAAGAGRMALRMRSPTAQSAPR